MIVKTNKRQSRRLDTSVKVRRVKKNPSLLQDLLDLFTDSLYQQVYFSGVFNGTARFRTDIEGQLFYLS